MIYEEPIDWGINVMLHLIEYISIMLELQLLGFEGSFLIQYKIYIFHSSCDFIVSCILPNKPIKISSEL